MWTRLLACTVAASAVAAAPAGAIAAPSGPTMRVGVSPRAGGVHTRFVVRFRAVQSTGVLGTITRRDAVVVDGPRRAGCVGGASAAARPAAAGAPVRVMLVPRGPGGRWCVGGYAGRVVESAQLTCRPGPVRACPDLAVAPRTIGRFRVRVSGH